MGNLFLEMMKVGVGVGVEGEESRKVEVSPLAGVVGVMICDGPYDVAVGVEEVVDTCDGGGRAHDLVVVVAEESYKRRWVLLTEEVVEGSYRGLQSLPTEYMLKLDKWYMSTGNPSSGLLAPNELFAAYLDQVSGHWHSKRNQCYIKPGISCMKVDLHPVVLSSEFAYVLPSSPIHYKKLQPALCIVTEWLTSRLLLQ
ncbi:hypothetical protein SAY87_028596 [Trapa incisa]|uniref:Uncharacterized protein n=1 Tax=Trapa incisa TaxID=236973 RepID=A0AAN7KUB3_9MYRT|nr:hypothetical protein SAY87_028596 [Trapa incisa]